MPEVEFALYPFSWLEGLAGTDATIYLLSPELRSL